MCSSPSRRLAVPFAELRSVFASRLGRASDVSGSPLQPLRGGIELRFLRRPVRPLGDQLTEAERVGFEEAIFVARQQLDAVDLLSNALHRSESMHVLARALSAIQDAIAHLRCGLPETARAAELLPETLTESLRAAQQRLEAAPRLSGSLSPEDIRFWRTTRARARRLSSWLLKLGRSRRVVLARRLVFAALSLGPVLVLLTSYLLYLHLRDPFRISDSDHYASDDANSAYRPEKATDGDATTEWLAPEGKDGWLDVEFFKPTRVTAISVTNARNAPHNDRGTQTLDIELFAGAEQVKRVEVTLEEKSATERRIEIEGAGITRVRLSALSHYGRGAGLAEVRVLDK